MHYVTRTRVIAACLATMVISLISESSVRAQDLSRQTMPGKWIEPLLPEDLPKVELPAYAKDLDRARAEAFGGRYKRSLRTLAKVKPTDADPAEVAIIRATSLAALGRRDEALKALSDQAVIDQPRVQVFRARLLAEVGRLDEAVALLKQHVAKNPDSITGHYYLGAISELTGDLATAKDAFGWFTADPQNYLDKAKNNADFGTDSAEDVTCIGRALDRWALINGQYQQNENLHDAILNVFIRGYDVIDRQYWPAHVAAAEYFRSHDDSKRARDELMSALRGNPQDIHTLELVGSIAIESYNFDGADAAVAHIRRVDLNSPRADLIEARNLLQQRQPKDAAIPVNRVLKQQPKNIEALGLLAATEALQLHDDQAKAVLKQVDAIDPDNASAYFEVAEQLSGLRQYPRAEVMYKIALERAPWWTSIRNGLGLLYTQSGDEDNARAVLEAAHSLDPFNLRTTNYLRLLDELAGFAKKESPNFVVMYDSAKDPVIPEYFNDYLEAVHADVCKDFNHTPSVKTYIEVFPTHDAFSVRTTGSPWIGTVGASTGRVIALVSPRKGENTLGPFNWSQVLRHEYTHTVTLSATDNRIPHWMTEGLAVWEEKAPLRWDWIPMLYHAVTQDELFTMDSLTWGFVRPKKPTDRQLAYAQSFWICTYIEEKYGHDAILKLLDQFRTGASQDDAFPAVLGISLSQFNDEFVAWAKKQVATWGYDKDTQAKYDKLRDKAENMIKARKYDEAIKPWEEIVKLRPVDALPHQRLAGLYINKQINQPEKAIEHLIVLAKVELKNNLYAKGIARLYRDEGKLDDAAKWALDAVYTEPYDAGAHQLLAQVYEKAGNSAGLDRENRVIAMIDQWQAAEKKRLSGEPDEPTTQATTQP